MERYRAAARQRVALQQQAMEARRQAAWGVARRAAALLKGDYGASRVALFGSLARHEPLSAHSDVDLVVWGLDERLYYRAVAQLLDLDPSITVDLLCAETLSTDFLSMVETIGVAL